MWPSLLLVFFIGFAAHRASLCTVRAVMLWVEKRQGSLLLSFLYASMWASLLAGMFVWMGWPIRGQPMLSASWAASLAGGLLFGMGAAVNGGCSLSTLQRLADGDLRYLTSLMCFVLGSAAVGVSQAEGWVHWPRAHALWWASVGADGQQTLLVVLLLWGAGQCWLLWRRVRTDPGYVEGPVTVTVQVLLAPRYRLTFAAMVLGVCSGLLFLLEGPWTYTNLLREVARAWVLDVPSPGAWRLALFAMLFSGMVASSVQRKQFDWSTARLHCGWRHVLGGGLMGVGGGLVPGGNDTVLLVLMPTLSLQALGSFSAMLVGIYLVVRSMAAMSRLTKQA